MSDLSASPGGPPLPFEDFVCLFVAHEARLRALLRSLLPARADVDDVPQGTSLVSYREFDRDERVQGYYKSVHRLRARLLDCIKSELKHQAP